LVDYKLLSHNSIQEFELNHSTTKTVWACKRALNKHMVPKICIGVVVRGSMSQTQFASQVLGGLLNSLSSVKVQDLLEIEHNRTTNFNFALREREREREREFARE